MELDELKQAWKTLDARLALQNQLQLDALRERKVGRIRARLRPLFWGQIVQMLFGVWFIAIGVDVWTHGRDVLHLLLAGLSIHALGLGMVIGGGVICGGILRIDPAAPVLALQRRLAQLRRAHLLAGMWVGLPWWVMWVPFVMVLAKSATGIDVYAVAATSSGAVNWLTISLGVGVLGLLATWAFHRGTLDPRRAALRRKLDDGAAGGSLRRAQAELDELARFAEE